MEILESIDFIEELILDNLGAIIIVAVIVGTYLYMNKPPPPPPVFNKPNNKINKEAQKPKKTITKNEDGKKVMKIFFGTQTRTAEDFSRIIEKECKKIGIPCEVVDLESYEHEQELHTESFVMFLVATHGEGDPTDNAKEFYLWLTNEERSTDHLNGVPFTVFGLGNKTYEHYNAVARVIDRRMEELGGKRVFERGEGDDDATLEEDFNRWKKDMWPVVCKFFGYELKSTEDDKFVPRFRMVTLNQDSKDINDPFIKIVATPLKPKLSTDNKVIYDMKNPYYAEVLENRELHSSESDRSCRHIEFKLGDEVSYTTGDHLGVFPINDGRLVEQLIKRLGVNGDDMVALIPIDQEGSVIKASFGPMTIRKAFSEHLDITNPVRKSVLRALAESTANEEEKKRLLYLATEEANEEYNKFIKNDFRGVIDLLESFPGLKPSIAHFLEFTPRLPARMYSISSSPHNKNGIVSITSVVVNFTTGNQRAHNGVASTWLSHLKVGDKVPLFVRESHFKLPPSPEQKPVIMVGPGTGLAPFRGFLQELQHRNHPQQQSLLFFGCRSDNVDYIYREELEQYHQSSVLENLVVAFSRKTTQKVYVQNKLLEHKEKVWELLNNGAYFYVCGDGRNMSKAVQQALLSIIKEFGSKDDNSAQQFIDDMSAHGRYLQDVWF